MEPPLDPTEPFRRDPKANRFITSVQPTVWEQYDDPDVDHLDLILESIVEAPKLAKDLFNAVSRNGASIVPMSYFVFAKLTKQEFTQHVLPLVDKRIAMVSLNRRVVAA